MLLLLLRTAVFHFRYILYEHLSQDNGSPCKKTNQQRNILSAYLFYLNLTPSPRNKIPKSVVCYVLNSDHILLCHFIFSALDNDVCNVLRFFFKFWNKNSTFSFKLCIFKLKQNCHEFLYFMYIAALFWKIL